MKKQYGSEFSLEDLRHSIINGEVVKKEKDEKKAARYKYTIIGQAISGRPIYSTGKIITVDKKKYFIITFHDVR